MSIRKKYSYWIYSGKYTAIQKFATLLIGIGSFMLLARLLGPEKFGVWGLFLIVTSISETIRIALLKNGFIRFFHQSPALNDRANLQGATLVLNLLMGLLLSIAFLVFGSALSSVLNAPDLGAMLQWYAITVIAGTFFVHFEILLNASVHFKGLCWMYCIRNGSLLLAMCIFFQLNIQLSLIELSQLYLGGMLLGTLTGWYYARPHLNIRFNNFNPLIRQQWNFGKYVFGTNASAVIFRSTDTFLTSTYFGAAIAAHYNASLRIGNLVDMPSQILGDTLFPKAANFDAADKASIKNMYEKSVGASLLFSVPALLVIMIFPGTILQLIAGEAFIVASPILRITAVFGFMLPFIKQFGTIMDATGKPQINFRVTFFAFCLNILTNLGGIYLLGFMGAAIGTAITYFVLLMVCQYFLYKYYEITFLNVFKTYFYFGRELIGSLRGKLKGA